MYILYLYNNYIRVTGAGTTLKFTNRTRTTVKLSFVKFPT